MKKAISISLFILIFFVLAPLWGGSLLQGTEKKQLTFEQVFKHEGEQILAPLPRIYGWADNNHYWAIMDNVLCKVDAGSGQSVPFIDYKSIYKNNGVQLWNLSDHTANFKKVLLVEKGDIYLFDLKTKSKTQITDTPGEEKNPTFSPDGLKFAFTLNGNLFVYSLADKKTIQVTSDGGAQLLNGYASWIYYEEILGRSSKYKAFWWSPDSKKIVFMQFDQTHVPEFPIVSSEGIYSKLIRQKYPKPGYPNPEVKIGIAEILSGDSMVRCSWIPFEDANDHYLSFPRWCKDSAGVYFQWLNRDQNHLKIYSFGLASGSLDVRYEEQQDTWVEFLEENDLALLQDGNLLIRSSRSGWYHLYYVSRRGDIQAVTGGDWSVGSIHGVVEKGRRKRIFFSAAKEDSTEMDFYRIDFTPGKKDRQRKTKLNKGLKRLTPEQGTHMAKLSPGGTYFIDMYSSINTPPRLELRNSRGKLLRKLGDSNNPVLASYLLPKKELFRVKTSDGYELPVVWYLPPKFDKQKKYPVIFAIYGGPGAMVVRNLFYRRSLKTPFLSQQGYIVLSVDHRGSGHFGKKGMDLMHRNLGKWELNDYKELLEYLKGLPFIDMKRIGIVGGSYGGYITALALVKCPEYFCCGLSGAPVMDWRFYDSVYTERYMDLPKDNPEGYRKASVLTYVDGYREGSLRIWHGTVDDNVHMQNTLIFIDKIQEKGRMIELMIYPGEKHTFGKKREYRERAELSFWRRHLLDLPE